MVDERTHTLICGDLAFMYDRNGLWNNYLKDNLKIIVFNNHGGGIFRTLPGARDQKELEEYFTVHQPLSFEHTALQHQCQYFYCDKGEDLEDKLSEFYATKGRPAVLEIDFDGSKYLSIGEVVKTINNQ
jgi:2-succinyl-5-enolpyruvyl-6-hydroxy-3-cyclohexene-1-carboxylate synthase